MAKADGDGYRKVQEQAAYLIGADERTDGERCRERAGSRGKIIKPQGTHAASSLK